MFGKHGRNTNEHENGSTHIYKGFKLKILVQVVRVSSLTLEVHFFESCMLWDREAKARQDRLLERRRQEALAREDAWMQMRAVDVYGRFMYTPSNKYYSTCQAAIPKGH